ncbi:RNA-directed DNA polymerase, eukaryota, reverse transcriptase zinc-binding domain protein [Tanacetum coccineum]
MFSALTDERDIEMHGEWKSMRSRINEACEKGLHISLEEKNDWNDDLREYFKMKMQELVRKQNVADLKLKVKNLERQIVHSNKMIAIKSRNMANAMMKSVMDRIKDLNLKLQLAEAELFFKTGQVFTINEWNDWSDEKLELYRVSIGKEGFENILKVLNIDRNEDMDDEVAEERSASAQFIVQDVISNVANLVDHKLVVSNDPWVLLEDFNVILRINENYNGLAVRDDGMQEFRGCVDLLEIEDISINGFFYTWIQKRKCPESGILKKLDRVMGNSHFVTSYPSSFSSFLPYLSSDHCPVVLTLPGVSVRKPRSFWFMNFLADKKEFLGVVKVIKTELSRVQEALDKDPSNASLREEEMIFYQAYKVAALDEEKLLQQKTKIEWLREGDFNSSFFHSSMKGRTNRNKIEVVYDGQGNAVYDDSIANMFVSHFESFLGTQDDVYPIEDAGILFLKKLDIDKAIDLIKPMMDNEVKDALFNIEDNKAASPDGYFSKFFKAAWSVIGKDVCYTTKEFFTSGKMLGDFNTTLISLVPKLKSPARVIDYQPISCCNVIYKIISKVITNRLKHVLGDLVDVNQSAFISDDLLMLCHGDMISSSILRHGLDEFSMSSGLYPSEAKSEAFFSGLTPKVTDEIKLVMPFREGSLPIRYLGVSLLSKRINKNDCRVLVKVVHNKLVYDTIDKIIKNFSWTKEGNANRKVSVCWKDMYKPKSQGGLGLKPLHDWNEALMAKHLWSIASNKDSIWVKWVKIYKVKENNLWDVELKKDVGLSLNAKVCDMIENESWKWPINWLDRSENESHSHLFLSCAYSKRLWERLKPMEMMDNMSNIWPSVISSIVNKPANNTIWSVIQRLVFGVAIYLLWLERNSRIYNQVDRTVDSIFEQVVSNVRLKLRGLVLKNSLDVLRAAEIWDLPIDKSGYYDKMFPERLDYLVGAYDCILLVLSLSKVVSRLEWFPCGSIAIVDPDV